MNHVYRIAGALALVAFVSIGTNAEDLAIRRELDSLNNALIRATVRRDSKAVMALMTPDFTLKQVNGTVYNKAQSEAQMKKTWPAIKAFRVWNLVIRDFTVTGNTAVGIVDEQLSVELKDKKGRVHPTMLLTATRNTWKKTSSGWKFARMEDIASRMVKSDVSYVPFGSMPRKRKSSAGTTGVVSDADARKFLEKAYAATRKAFNAKDANGVLALTTPDYTVEYATRSMTRRQVRDSLVSELKATKAVSSWVQSVGDITITRDTIVAQVKERKVSTLVGARGKSHSQVVEDTTRDAWRLTSAGWMNVKTTVLSSRVIIDGKVQAS